MTLDYLSAQIDAGAEAVQLFDSWAGSLSPAQFERLGDRADRTDRRGFARAASRGAGDRLSEGRRRQAGAYARETGVTRVGLDETVDPLWAAKELPARPAGAGQSRPACAGCRRRATAKSRVGRILDAFADRPHIFNLGHGILQDTPIEHVGQLIALVKGDK